MKYYVRVGAENQGPFTFEELENKGLEPTTYIWHEGLGDWVRASQVPELQSLFPISSTSISHDTSMSSSPFPDTEDRYSQEMERSINHSGYGIASCILWFGAIIIALSTIVVAGMMFPDIEELRDNPENIPPEFFAISCVLCSVPLPCLLGLVLGVAGVFQTQRKKFFSILGIILNSIVLICMLVLFLISSIISAMPVIAP